MNNCKYPYQFGISIVISVYVFAFSLLLASGLRSQSLFLIHGRPCAEKPGHIPYPTIIYKFNEAGKCLDSVWSLGTNKITWSIDVYTGPGPVIISDGYGAPSEMYILAKSSMPEEKKLDLADLNGVITNFYYYSESDGMTGIQVEYMEFPLNESVGKPFKLVAFSDNSKGHMTKAAGILSIENMRLTGPRSSYGGGGKDDIVSLMMKEDGSLWATHLNLTLDGAPVPDSIVTMKTSFGWVMIANEPAFRALLSVPDKNGLTHRELLIYDKQSGIWKSLLLDGAETSPMLINGWLIGVIADPAAETDYIVRKGGPSVLREEAVLVNPLEGRKFNVHLGEDGEVLWIEGDDVYFRTGASLYKARMQNDDFVDRTLLLTDPRVENIHWAFRGSVGADSK